MPHGIHHLTFVVRDLGASVRRWSVVLGAPWEFATLADRDVRTARFEIGSAHVVLVQPMGDHGEPARILRERGEGLLLVSLGVTDLDAALGELQRRGVEADGAERVGLSGWRVQDLRRDHFDDVLLQLCESEDSTRSEGS